MKKILGAMFLFLFITLFLTSTNYALTLDTNNINSYFTVNFLLENGATDPNSNTNNTGVDLSATVIFTNHGFISNDSNTILSLGLSVTNNTSESDANAGLQTIAFGIDPKATDAILTDIESASDVDKFLDDNTGIEITSELNNILNLSTLPQDDDDGRGIETDTDNGYNRTLQEQQTDDFILSIIFTGNQVTSATINPFASKWQTALGSFEFGGTETETPTTPPASGVPEPGTIFLLGVGLLGVAGVGRKRFKK